MEHCELSQQVLVEPDSKRFMEHFEFKITFPLIALLPKFSDNQICIVICIGPMTYRYGISEKTSDSMVPAGQESACMAYWPILSHLQP